VAQTSLEILFWLSVILVLYVYVGYPVLLYIFARKNSASASSIGTTLPRVTLLISAYNEMRVISEKLRNALALDYPSELLRIVVISDSSNDGTDEIVRQFGGQGICLVRQPERLGKSAGINLGMQEARGDIVVFSDANSIYQPDAVRRLVSHFSDPRVGYVVGNCAYRTSSVMAASAESEGLYWKLETWLKEKESNFGSVVGGDGAIYAIRRELFIPLEPTDINDFLNPLQIIVRGYRGVYDREAICYEEAGDSFEKEFRRKVRIVSRSFNAVCRAPRVLLLWNQPRHWLALVSHKVLRWLVPLYLIDALLTSVLLWRVPFFRIAVVLQTGFYLLAAAGWAFQSGRSTPKILFLPYYFVLINLASLFGVVRALTGSLSPTWQTIREEKPADQESPVSLAGKET
jgi:cellulose synthase/poly-beta-1,6-N-acetylglucosamine synthase-like glycosyltransferase